MIRVLALCFLLASLAGDGLAAPSERIGIRSVPERVQIEGWGDLAPPQTSDLAVLEEFMIDTTLSWFGAPDWQWSPSIAFDGTNYLVVWHDDRNGLDYGIYGTRVTQDGAVLDPRGITISDMAEDQSYPSVGFNGVQYFVVWQDKRSGSGYDIYGTRVSTSGSVLDPSGLPVSTKPTRERYPKIAFDGANYLVVWEEGIDKCNFDICGTRVGPFGNVLDPLGIIICDDSLCQRFPSVTFGSGNYLVAWDNGSRTGTDMDTDIYAARIDPLGNLRDSTGIVVCSTSYMERSPALSFDGRNYMVVWEHWWGQEEIDILGARMDTSGAVLDPSPTAICTLAGSDRHPALAFGDGVYFLAWERRGRTHWDEHWKNICGAVLDTLGQVTPWWMDSVAVTDAPMWQRSPALAFDGTNHFVVWGDDRNVDGDVYGSRVKNWNVLDQEGICLSRWPDRKWYPSAAFAGADYLVVWQNAGKDGYDIRAARVSQAGSVLDPSGIILSGAARSQSFPHVASDGVDYLVVWENDLEEWEQMMIWGSRVSENGVVLDTSGIEISGSPGYSWDTDPALAYNGEHYLVAWADWEHGVGGARVDRFGSVDTLLTRICTGVYMRPSVASDGSDWLVTADAYGGIRGTRVSAQGTVLDSVPFIICTTLDRSLCAHHKTVFGGGTYFVVWEDIRNGPEYDVYGARVDTSGTLLDTSGIAIATGPGYQAAPSAVFDGDNYLVVWEDWQSGKSDLCAARVDTSGVVMDSGGFKIVDKPEGRMAPYLAKGADNELLLVYDGIAGYPYSTYRVFGALYTDVGTEELPTPALGGPRFALEQSAPNPFTTVTEVRYAIPARSQVLLRVYDVSGRVVSELESGEKPAGWHTVAWDGRDESGKELPSGVYFCRLKAGGATAARKIILVR